MSKIITALTANSDNDPMKQQQVICGAVAALVDDKEFSRDSIRKLLEIIDWEV